MLVLDTHVLVWLDEGSARLGSGARRAIDAAWRRGELAASAISFWEVATLRRKGRLDIRVELVPWRAELLGMGLREIAVTGESAITAGELADFHGDPADRMIVAAARSVEAPLCTADERILAWLPKRACLNARK